MKTKYGVVDEMEKIEKFQNAIKGTCRNKCMGCSDREKTWKIKRVRGM